MTLCKLCGAGPVGRSPREQPRDGGGVDLEEAGRSGGRLLAFQHHLANRGLLVRGELGAAAPHAPFLPGGLDAGSGAFPQHGALELREGPHHVHQHPVGWRRRVYRLGFVGSLALGLAACGSDSSPTAPTPPSPQSQPDLVVASPSVSDSNPAPDTPFTLSVTVRNDGDEPAASTTLRYYQSTDATITTSDTAVGTDAVAGLTASGSSSVSVALTAPSTAGTYYHGACVDAVTEESDTTNNCSSSVTVTVAPAPAPPFTLTGTVRDSRRTPGFVLPGASVRLENGESTTTGPDGLYRFLNVSGAITVTATAPNYVTQTIEVMVDSDRTLDFNLEHRATAQPPYLIWTLTEILDSADTTSLQSIAYAGREMRQFWDNRTYTWIVVNVYLFNVRYVGRQVEFQMHPELGSQEAARAEVDTYAPILGRLPAVLLSRVGEVEISPFYEERLGANAREGIIHINTGHGEEIILDGRIEEAFLHEAGHVSLDLAHANSLGWRAAQQADVVFIDNYARDYPDREDIASSIVAYFIVKYRPERVDKSIRDAIRNAIPNRLAYFDGLGLDMSPYTATGSIVPGRGVSSVEPTRGR